MISVWSGGSMFVWLLELVSVTTTDTALVDSIVEYKLYSVNSMCECECVSECVSVCVCVCSLLKFDYF